MSCNHNNALTNQASRANGISRSAGKSAGVALRMNPAVKREAVTGRDGKYTITPLPVGYGVTLGNAMRRTLLGGLKGAAITSVKVNGIDHEFSTIPHVREDMTALILNMKGVRLKFKSDKPARLSLKVRGEGVVTAGDLDCPSHVEVVNPDLPLLTGDSADAKVDLEFSAGTGYGYSPSEERLGLPIGEMPIDAVFSPIRQATFQVTKPGVAETARVGHTFDNLTVSVKTDGTIPRKRRCGKLRPGWPNVSPWWPTNRGLRRTTFRTRPTGAHWRRLRFGRAPGGRCKAEVTARCWKC